MNGAALFLHMEGSAAIEKMPSNARKSRNILALMILAVISCLFVASCSTTRLLADGEYRLNKNKIVIEGGDKDLDASKVQSYVRQKAKGWGPGQVIYNWGGKNPNSFFTKIFRRMGSAPVIYNSAMVEASEVNIANRLEYLGYYGSHVDADVAVNGKKVFVTYRVRPGNRYTIRDITYELPLDGEFSSDFMSDSSAITIKKGDYLSEASLEAETARGASVVRDMGYYEFNKNYYFFEADTLSRDGTAALRFMVKNYTRSENPSAAKPFYKYTFGDVSMSWPVTLNIRPRVLRHINVITPGAPYSEDIVNNTYSRLSALRLWNGVNVDLRVSEDEPAKVDCDINLTPSQLQGFKLNLEGSTNSSGLLGISPELSYYHKNIFHGAETLTLSFMGNFQFKPNQNVRSTELGASASIGIPKFLLLPDRLFRRAVPRTEFSASFNYQDRPEYKRTIISTTYGYTGSHKNLYYQFQPAQLSIVRLFSLDPEFFDSLPNNPALANAYVDHFDLGLGGTLYYTTDASTNPHSSYHYVRFQFSSAGNLLSLFKDGMKTNEQGRRTVWNTPYSQYVRADLTLGKTWRFGKKDAFGLATRLEGGIGWAYGNSFTLPYEQQFSGGGANSLRGWAARSVGPGNDKLEKIFVIPSQTGDMKLEANAELRFPLVWKLAGAFFVDAGNVWQVKRVDPEGENPGLFTWRNLGESIALDSGIGIRLDLNFILVRLDAGLVIHDPSRDYGERWVGPRGWIKSGGYGVHFGVGYPF